MNIVAFYVDGAVQTFHDHDNENMLQIAKSANPNGEGFVVVNMDSLPTSKQEYWAIVNGVVIIDSSRELIELKSIKKDEINRACRAAIVAGFTSSALGSPYAYDFADYDQINLADEAMAGVDTVYPCTDSSGAKAEVAHTAAQISQVHLDGLAHRKTQLTKVRGYKASLELALSIADVEAIVWN